MAHTFSDQLRQAVRDCGTSRYALARQLSISESTLSRFLSGERGLTLDLLDQLADVLGLKIVVTMQRVARPSRRGPKPKGEKKMLVKTKVNWEVVAMGAAKDASENNFSSRRGIYFFEDVNVLCVYNNHPYGSEPLTKQTRRDKETADFRCWLKQQDIKELGYATYPETGEDAGYTYAMLLDAGADRQYEVSKAMEAIVMESWKRSETVTEQKK